MAITKGANFISTANSAADLPRRFRDQDLEDLPDKANESFWNLHCASKGWAAWLT
jgi:hypothetical protein